MSRTTAAGHTGFVLCGGLVEELLRYEPPVHMLPNRTTPADINIAGTTIPQGSPLMLMLASGSRDPNPTLQICRRVSVVAGVWQQCWLRSRPRPAGWLAGPMRFGRRKVITADRGDKPATEE